MVSLDRAFRDAFTDSARVCGSWGPYVFGLCSDCPQANISVSGMQQNIQHIKSKIKMATWNLDGFKTGICSSASIVNPSAPSALCLANNCAIAKHFVESGGFLSLFQTEGACHTHEIYGGSQIFGSK